MRTVWIDGKSGFYEKSGDLDVMVSEDGTLRVRDYEARQKTNCTGDIYIVAPGAWMVAEVSDEYPAPCPAPIATLPELNARLAAYDSARSAFNSPA